MHWEDWVVLLGGAGSGVLRLVKVGQVDGWVVG